MPKHNKKSDYMEKSAYKVNFDHEKSNYELDSDDEIAPGSPQKLAPDAPSSHDSPSPTIIGKIINYPKDLACLPRKLEFDVIPTDDDYATTNDRAIKIRRLIYAETTHDEKELDMTTENDYVTTDERLIKIQNLTDDEITHDEKKLSILTEDDCATTYEQTTDGEATNDEMETDSEQKINTSDFLALSQDKWHTFAKRMREDIGNNNPAIDSETQMEPARKKRHLDSETDKENIRPLSKNSKRKREEEKPEFHLHSVSNPIRHNF